MNLSIKIEGIDHLTSKLESLCSGDALAKGLLKAGEIVKGEAYANCPVDTGDLRASIVVQQADGNSVTVGPTKDYGIFVEFGTGTKGDKSVAHTTKKGWVYYSEKLGRFVYTTGQAPQPFLVPALFSQKDAVVEAIKNGLLEAL